MIRHLLYYAMARGGPGLIAVAALPLLTRLLPPGAYGAYAVVVSWVALANGVLYHWLRLGLLRYYSTSPDTRPLRATVLRAFVGVSVVAALGAGGASLVLAAPVRDWVLAGVLVLWGQAWFELNQQLFSTRLDPLRYGVIGFVKSLLSVGFAVGAAWLGWGASGVLLGLALGYILSGLWAVGVWRDVWRDPADPQIMRRLLHYGLPLTFSVGVTFVIGYANRQLLAHLRSLEEAARYAAAHDLAEQSLGMLMSLASLAAHPLIVKAYETEGLEATRDRLRQGAAVLLAVTIPALLGLALVTPEVAEVFLGEAFRPAAIQILPWLAGAVGVLGFKSFYLDLAFQLSGRTADQAWINLIGALSSVGLNLLWIPRHGYMGAAYATVAAYLLVAAMSGIRGRACLPLPLPWAEGGRVLVCSGVMAGVLVLLPWRHLGTLVIAGSLGYGISAFALNLLGLRTTIRGRMRPRSAHP